MSFFKRCLNTCHAALAGAVMMLLMLPTAGQSRIASDTGIVTLGWDRNPETNIAGYRFHFGTESGNYDQVVDMGNLSEAVLNMTAGRTYYCAVSAYNFSGLESDLSAELAVTYVSGATPVDNSSRLVMLEAEAGVLGSPMVATSGTNETWIDSSVWSQQGTSTLAFNAPLLSDYVVWCRVKAPSNATDSFFYSFDGGAEQIFHVHGNPAPPAGTHTSGWIWRRMVTTTGDPVTFNLSQGPHSLKFRVREPGTLLDRIVLSNDTSFVPSDTLPRSGDALTIVSAPQSKSVTAGETASLSVKAAATGPVTYQWKKNGISIPGANSSTFAIANSVAGDSGIFSVVLTAGAASANGGPATLTINAAAMKIGSFSVSEDQTVTFDMNDALGALVHVYASNNLSDWEYIGNVPNNTGTIVIDDPEGAGSTKRFYKLSDQAP